jgi:predicted nucleic-acid-binding Zn-ribbon protein
MKKVFLFTALSAILLMLVGGLLSCNKDDKKIMQMTMITEGSDMYFRITGTGTMTIDWGDGTKTTYTVPEGDIRLSTGFLPPTDTFRHVYSNASSRKITITGENITQFLCVGNKLTKLDVSKNTNLKVLQCGYNSLTTLDVSNNTNLTDLECWDNHWADLNLNKNTALEVLRCDKNRLRDLDLSSNVALRIVSCSNNLLRSLNLRNNTSLSSVSIKSNMLQVDDLLTLFETLPNNGKLDRWVYVHGNPGTRSLGYSNYVKLSNGWTVDPISQ